MVKFSTSLVIFLILSVVFIEIECDVASATTPIPRATRKKGRRNNLPAIKLIDKLVKEELSPYKDVNKNETIRSLVHNIIYKYERMKNSLEAKIEEAQHSYERKLEEKDKEVLDWALKHERVSNNLKLALRGYVMVVLRSRIEDLKTKYGLNCQASMKDMLEKLGLTPKSALQKTTKLDKRIEQAVTDQLEALEAYDGSVLFTTVGTKKSSQDDRVNMASALKERIAAHYVKWKFIFTFGTHSDIKNIKKWLLLNDLTEEDFLLEVAFLFIKTSHFAIHSVPYPIPVDDLLQMLKCYEIDPITEKAVKALYWNRFTSKSTCYSSTN